jgi:hypothetical protein
VVRLRTLHGHRRAGVDPCQRRDEVDVQGHVGDVSAG